MPMRSYKNIEHTKFNKIKFNKETKKARCGLLHNGL